MNDRLQRLSGDDVGVVHTSATELDRVKVDPCQVEQIITNLVANACDAMGRVVYGAAGRRRVRTGHEAERSTFSATLPRRKCCRPPIP